MGNILISITLIMSTLVEPPISDQVESRHQYVEEQLAAGTSAVELMYQGVMYSWPEEMLLDLVSHLDADELRHNERGHSLLPRATRMRRYSRFAVSLIENGAPIDSTHGDRHRTALIWAAMTGQTEVAKRLLEAGADASMVDTLRWNATMYALGCGNRDIAEMIADEAGIEIPVKNDYENVCLLAGAVQRGDKELVIRLLDDGTELNLLSSWAIPIYFAANTGSLEMIEILLEHGADPRIRRDNGENAIDVARSRMNRIRDYLGHPQGQDRVEELKPKLDEAKRILLLLESSDIRKQDVALGIRE